MLKLREHLHDCFHADHQLRKDPIMRLLTSSLLTLLLAILYATVLSTQLCSAATGQQQNEGQSSQEQQAQPPEGEATQSAVVKTVTGCVVQTDQGYSLKTATDTYPIETDRDLSKYVNKQVKVTGILEHQHTPTSSSGGNAATVTDIRLRMVASIIGDCPSK
jgi:hypothetical protein